MIRKRGLDGITAMITAIMLMTALLAVFALPIKVSAEVTERPPEIPESELVGNSAQGQKAIPPEYPGDGTEKPASSDFEWVSGVTNIFNVPEGADSLRSISDIKGDWKGFLVGQPTEYFIFYGTLNTKIEDKGNNNISFRAKWKNDTLVNNKTGEIVSMDSASLGDTDYYGGITDESLYAEDRNSDPLLRHMFVSGDMILDFIIVNFYQQGNRQYALGIFESDTRKQIGNVYLTRTVSGKKKSSASNQTITTEWSGFSGLWVYEYTDDYGNVDRYSYYIEPISADKAYVVLCDEIIDTQVGIVGTMKLDHSNNHLYIYAPDGSLFDVLYFVDKGVITVEDAGGWFYKKDKSWHSAQYWNHIGNKFKEANEWYY